MDECIVGRGLLNDELDGWMVPCPEPATEDFFVPIAPGEQDIWKFCKPHGKQFQQALLDAQMGVRN